MKEKQSHHLLLFSLLVLVGVWTYGVYHNSLDCDMVFDDHLAVRNNADVKGETDLYTLFTNDFWGRNLKSQNTHKSWRPLVILTFRWNYYLADGFTAWFYHLTNNIFHVFATFLVIYLSYFLNSASPSSSLSSSSSKWGAALVSGIIFGVHSCHVEAVTGLVGRAEILGAIFAMFTFICGLQSFFSSNFFGRFFWWLLMLIFYFFGCLSKETSVTILGMVGFYDMFYVLFPALFYSSSSSSRFEVPDKNKFFGSVGLFVARSLFLVFLFAGFLVVRTIAMSDDFNFEDTTLQNSLLIRKTENPFHFLPDPLSKLLSKLFLQAYYSLILLFPLHLSAEYSFNCIPPILSLSDPRNLSTLFLFVFLGGFSVYSVLKIRKSPSFLLFLWILLAHIPGSGLFMVLGTLLAERLLYLPSIGFCLLIGQELAELWEAGWGEPTTTTTPTITPTSTSSSSSSPSSPLPPSSNSKKRRKKKQKKRKLFPRYLVIILGTIVFFWVVWMSFRTFDRNLDWRTDKTLFFSAVETCPESAKMHRQLGQVYTEENKPDLVLKHLTKSYEIDPDYCELHFDFGMYHYAQQNVSQFLKEMRKATLCRFTAAKAITNLQEIYMKVLFPRKEPWVYREYAEIMFDLNATELASTYFREAGVLSYNGGDGLSAVQYFLKANEVFPRCDIWWWIAQVYESQGSVNDAKQLYLQALNCEGAEQEQAKRAAQVSLHLLLSNHPELNN